jgi:acetyl-CoA acetyltransferase
MNPNGDPPITRVRVEREDDVAILLIDNPPINAGSLEALGCANQADEDNRNVARMASPLAGLPQSVGGSMIVERS